jgi:hypothetical protein
MTILGIDPGAHGAVAVLDESGELREVLDMPSTTEANGRTSTNAPLLAGTLCSRACPRRLLRVRRSPTNGREGCGLRGRPRRGLPDRVRRFAAGEPPMTRKRLHDSLRSGTRRPRGVRRAPNEIHCLPRQSSAD